MFRRVLPEQKRADAARMQEEQFHTLALRLDRFRGQGLKAFTVTSTKQGEGKSFVAVRLARTLEELGASVLIIDFDLRRPTLHTLLQLENKTGFSDLLKQGAGLEAALQQSSERLFALTGGTAAGPHGPPSFHADRAREILQDARSRFDTVLIDTPPLLAVSDATLLNSFVDGILFVANARTLKEREARQARTMIEETGGRIVGTVLNRFDLRYGMGSQKYFNSYLEGP